jgi:hypothetical protein
MIMSNSKTTEVSRRSGLAFANLNASGQARRTIILPEPLRVGHSVPPLIDVT